MTVGIGAQARGGGKPGPGTGVPTNRPDKGNLKEGTSSFGVLKKTVRITILFACTLMAAALPVGAAPGLTPAAALETMPAWFEPNHGQYEAGVRFFSRGARGTAFLEARGGSFVSGGAGVNLSFAGASPTALAGADPLPSRSAYLVGNDRAAWRKGVPQFRRVRGRGLYPGIDVVYYFQDRQLEFDLEIAPHADASRVRLRFHGARRLRIGPTGGLIVETAGGDLKWKPPVAWQDTPAGRVPVAARYVASRGEVRFALGRYDRRLPLTIDPLLYTGYFGGDRNETANAIAIDRAGNVWVTGSSASSIPLPPDTKPLQTEPKGARDAFLAKFTADPTGELRLAYWTHFGGSGDDEAAAITTDNLGFVYIAGSTGSIDFPRGGPSPQQEFGGETDAFVTQLRPDDPGGEILWFSAFYGGPAKDVANAVALDAEGNVYIAGYSTSETLAGQPTDTLQSINRGGFEGFIAKMRPGASSPLTYSTFFGGSRTDVINAIAVDAAGNVYVAGYTGSEDFPNTIDSHRDRGVNSIDTFIAKMDFRRPFLDSLLYCRYTGGGNLDVAQAMAIDRDGQIWLAGYTVSTDYPVTQHAYRATIAGGTDGFLTRYDLTRPTNEEITYSTYLGGRATDVIYGLALAQDGRVAVAGYTFSDDFPLLDSQPPSGARAGADAFFTLIDPSRTGDAGLVFSRVVGGVYTDVATGVAVAADGTLYVSGASTSPDILVTDGSSKLTPPGSTQSFVVRAVSR